MAKRKVMLSYTSETITEPIIYTIGQQFNLAVNIRQADLAEDRGWIVVEFEGNEDDIESGLDWVISRGVRVDPAGER